MSSKTQMCSGCYFDNHPGTRFCVKCGRSLTKPSGAQPIGASDDPEPHESPEVPLQATEDLLKRVVRESGYESRKTKAGYRVVVPLGEQRKQKVHVLFSGHDDDGHDIISFISICAPASDRHASALLRLNNKLTYGAFAAKTIQGKEYFVVTANQLAVTADAQEIRKQLFEVAKRADAVENLLTRGKDVF